MRRLLVLLLVVVVLAIVADRGGAYVAGRVAATKLQQEQGLTDRPDVSIEGIPFLTQLASGHYDHLHVTVDDVELGSGDTSLALADLVLDFRDVRTDRDFTSVHVARASATATITYAELGRRLGATISYVGGDRISAARSITILGRTVSPSVTVAPSVTDGALTFGAQQVGGLTDLPAAVRDALPSSVTSALEGAFGDSVGLDGVPFDVTLAGVDADADGLELTLRGSDLSFSR